VADNEGKVLDKIRGLMLLISAAALASAALTVWSVMATTVLERRAEIAIMQATGAANRVVAALFVAEVALEGAAGGLIGALAGAQLAGWVGEAVFQARTQSPALLVPLTVVVAVAVAIAGAAQPLRRSLGLEPAVTLRGGD
jgi:putative ABC transport system permease protein